MPPSRASIHRRKRTPWCVFCSVNDHVVWELARGPCESSTSCCNEIIFSSQGYCSGCAVHPNPCRGDGLANDHMGGATAHLPRCWTECSYNLPQHEPLKPPPHRRQELVRALRKCSIRQRVSTIEHTIGSSNSGRKRGAGTTDARRAALGMNRITTSSRKKGRYGS